MAALRPEPIKVGEPVRPRLAVVTLFHGSRAVAASCCWPGGGTQEAKRLTEALGKNRHRFYTHISVKEYDFVTGTDGIQNYVEPRKVVRYGHR